MQAGSAVMFALFACLGIALAIQILSVAVVCGERALTDEQAGRARLCRTDEGLESMSVLARRSWGPAPWTEVPGTLPKVVGRIAEETDGGECVERAEVYSVGSSPAQVTSCLVERGRDGLDLPEAAVVAASVCVDDGRDSVWLSGEADDSTGAEQHGEGAQAIVYLRSGDAPPNVGSNVDVRRVNDAWALDEGWVFGLKGGELVGPRVTLLSGLEGSAVEAPKASVVSSEDQPVVIVVCDGADLDLRHHGEVWGVVVVDGGSLRLEGTTVHGAVFVGGRLELGTTGRVVFSESILCWATDRSLVRTRLVPSTRREGTG